MADKIQKSYRIDSDVVTDLAKLTDHFQKELSEKAGVRINISPATVIELLVKEKMKELNERKDS